MIPSLNFTCTPNIFFDEMIQTLNEGELRVILIIIRQTFGWGKNSDWMSASFLAKKTGYDRRSIYRIIARLVARKLIGKKVVKEGSIEKCYYYLIAEKPQEEKFEEEDGIESKEDQEYFQQELDKQLKNISTSDRPVIGTSDRRVTPPVTDGSPTKETHTKETHTKLSVTAGGAAVLERQDQEKDFSEEDTSSEETDLPNQITITTTGNRKLQVTQSDIYAYVVGQKIECTTEAIRYAWKALCECDCIIHDWQRFISGTINNYKNKKRSVNISKEKQKDIIDGEIEREVERIKKQQGLDKPKENNSDNTPTLGDILKQKGLMR